MIPTEQIKEFCELINLDYSKLFSRSRERWLVDIRYSIMEFLHVEKQVRICDIARYFNMSWRSTQYGIQQSDGNRLYNGSQQTYDLIKEVFNEN